MDKQQNSIYLNPKSGADTNSGAKDSPLRTLAEAARRVNLSDGAGSMTIILSEGIYAVGRAQLAPRDAYISKVQMHVAATNGSVHIQDADSTNKTHVDGRIAASPTLLHPGSQITIAGNLAIYRKH